MSERSAAPVIRGYYYQFDATILKILDTADGGCVVLEQIEDIDVWNANEITAIQCKYIPSKKYSDSAIRDALIAMLAGFLLRGSGQAPIRYCLYGHYADMPPVLPPLSLADLKRILTFIQDGRQVNYHLDHAIADSILQDFLDRLTLYAGPEYEAQKSSALGKLQQTFQCTDDEADRLYYNNALRTVLDLSVKPDAADRTISRTEFVGRISVKAPLFSLWYSQLKGREAYRRHCRERIKATKAIHPQKATVIFLDNRYLHMHGCPLDGAGLIINLVLQYYPLGKVFYNTVPLTIIVDGSASDIEKIKRALLSGGIVYNDGFEPISFMPDYYNSMPIVVRSTVGAKATEKVAKASYRIRLLSAQCQKDYRGEIFRPDTVLFFSDKEPRDYFSQEGSLILPLSAYDLEDISAITMKG
jgi:hypothetical protein